MNISRRMQGMVIVSVIIVFVVINYLIVLSLAKAAAKADRELKEIHKAFSPREEGKRGGDFNRNKQVSEQNF
jgi:hypothetical protein